MSRKKSKQTRAMVEVGKQAAAALANAGIIAANTPVVVVAGGHEKAVTAVVKEAR